MVCNRIRILVVGRKNYERRCKMKIVNRGDVYFCRGRPGTVGCEERKTRPVIIVQNDIGNAKSQTTIAVPLTSNTDKHRHPMQFYLQLPGHRPSKALCDQIMTIDKQRLLNKVYQLTARELQQLDCCLKVSLGLQ